MIYVHASELAAESGEDVFFRGWQYRTDIVQSNIDRYNNEMGGNVDYATVTGDYHCNHGTKLNVWWRFRYFLC